MRKGEIVSLLVLSIVIQVSILDSTKTIAETESTENLDPTDLEDRLVDGEGDDEKDDRDDKRQEGEDDKGQDGKVTLCHIPAGNPDAAHTISVSPSAVHTHLGHGDSLGTCEALSFVIKLDETMIIEDSAETEKEKKPQPPKPEPPVPDAQANILAHLVVVEELAFPVEEVAEAEVVEDLSHHQM